MAGQLAPQFSVVGLVILSDLFPQLFEILGAQVAVVHSYLLWIRRLSSRSSEQIPVTGYVGVEFPPSYASPLKHSLEAVREGSSTGKSPQHQAAHHSVDHRLSTLAQPFVVLAHPSTLS